MTGIQTYDRKSVSEEILRAAAKYESMLPPSKPFSTFTRFPEHYLKRDTLDSKIKWTVYGNELPDIFIEVANTPLPVISERDRVHPGWVRLQDRCQEMASFPQKLFNNDVGIARGAGWAVARAVPN